MSVLGIRNEIHDLGVRYDVKADIGHALAKRIMGTALMTEASLADWEKKYPSDNQIARDVYLLQHLYAKIDYDNARSKAKYVAQWLIARYPNTWYAKNMRVTMARVLGAPATAQPSTVPTSSTSPSAAPSQTPSPSAAETPGTLIVPNSLKTLPPSESVEPSPQPPTTILPTPPPTATPA